MFLDHATVHNSVGPAILTTALFTVEMSNKASFEIESTGDAWIELDTTAPQDLYKDITLTQTSLKVDTGGDHSKKFTVPYVFLAPCQAL